MKIKTIFGMCLLAAIMCSPAMAQHEHADIEFGYDIFGTPTEVEVEAGEFTDDGFGFFESTFEDEGTPGDFETDEPGFVNAPAEGLYVGDGHAIWIEILNANGNATGGQGFVNFYNPDTDMLEAAGEITISDSTGSTSDLELNGASQTGDLIQLLGVGGTVNPNELHDHLEFDLISENLDAGDPNNDIGAYGILLRIHSDFELNPPGSQTFDLSSDPFWIVFNAGMSEEDFEELAVPRFGVTEAIPEPGSMAILAALSSLAIIRRKRA